MSVPDTIARLPLFIALVLIPAICWSQTEESSQPQRTIRGEVVNSITGQPIANALVQISGPLAALTDPDGRFEFRDASSGRMEATATKPGYFPDQPGAMDTFVNQFSWPMRQVPPDPLLLTLWIPCVIESFTGKRLAQKVAVVGFAPMSRARQPGFLATVSKRLRSRGQSQGRRDTYVRGL
jgi:hypothetical protein